MKQLVVPSKRALGRVPQQIRSCLNALRFGFVFVRARWFKMPQKIKAVGKSVALHFPPDHSVSSDFLACCINNDYGLRRRLKNVETILDIGANVGFFSVAARSHYPRATIHAYEPNRRVLPFLRSNTAPLGIDIYPEAVGAHSGYVSMLDIGDSNQARTLSNGDGDILQVSLDTAVERLGGTVDLLKLDCEGAEWDMFRSESPWLRIRNVRMEYHLFHGESVQDVEQALSGLGFETTHWRCDVRFGIVWAVRSSLSR
jgi:FkbM family methyltransferase